MHDKTDIHHGELIKRRKDYYRKKRNHDNKIVFMKIDFIEYRKRKNLKGEQEKRFKSEKKCYSCDKKGYFVRDCRLKKNRRQINVLIKVFDKTEAQKKESETDTSEVSTNNEYYRVENVDKL